MAITKVLHMSADYDNAINSHLNHAIDYIFQEKKLSTEHLVAGINCMVNGAYEQMMDTKKMFGKTGGRQGYQFIISLKPGEGTPKEMYEIAMKFADEAFHNEYEAVVAVHTDKERIHAHIIINSVNMVTGYKFQYKKGDWQRIYQPITNRLCEEYGLSVVPAEYSTEPTNVSRAEYQQNQKFRDYIREDCECILAMAEDTAHFIWILRELGYDVKEGMHIAVKVPGMKRYARLDTIDKKFSRENIEQSISGAQGRKARFPVRTFNTDSYGYYAKSPYQKQMYYQIRGMRVAEKYRFSYKAAKYYKDILLMHKLQEEYLFLCDNNINSFEDLVDYRVNAIDELEQIREEQQELYRKNAALKRKYGTMDSFEYELMCLKNRERLDVLKNRAQELRKGTRIAEKKIAASINESLERLGRTFPTEDFEINPYISDVPEYPIAVARLKAEVSRRKAAKAATVAVSDNEIKDKAGDSNDNISKGKGTDRANMIVTKQEYKHMTDKEKAEWIGLTGNDMSTDIKTFQKKMEQIGIRFDNILDMTDEFMKIWKAAESKDELAGRQGQFRYGPIRRR